MSAAKAANGNDTLQQGEKHPEIIKTILLRGKATLRTTQPTSYIIKN